MASLCQLPVELLTEILFQLDSKNLRQTCVHVSKRWNQMISSVDFWRRYHKHWMTNISDDVFEENLPWDFFACIDPRNNPFDRNLLINGSAENVPFEEMEEQRIRISRPPDLDPDDIWDVPCPDYLGWEIMGNAGLGWRVELRLPQGPLLRFPVDPVERDKGINQDFIELPGCFISSYHSCTKWQDIDLEEIGFPSEILDSGEFKCLVTMEEWYTMTAPSFIDFGLYTLTPEKTIKEEKVARIRHLSDPPHRFVQWRRLTLSLKSNLKGCRYLRFYHGSTADVTAFQNAANEEQLANIGVKFGGGKLTISYPMTSGTD